VILPKIPTSALKGIVPVRRNRPVSLQQMKSAIADGASEGIRRGKRR